ncbi:MAG: alpha/beta hydrolase [Chloroflexota bacterium]
MPFVSVSDAKIYYELKGAGTCLVFIHGFSLSSRMWNRQVEYFSNHFHTLTYDLRGFGQSSIPNSSYSHSEDLAALLGQININEAVLVGLSRGGRVAIDFALAYPEKTKGLILADTAPVGFFAQNKRTSESSFLSTIFQKQGLNAALSEWLSSPLFNFDGRNFESVEETNQIVQDYSGWHWHSEDPLIESSPYAITQLGKIKTPTLILVGENDIEQYQQAADLMKQGIENSKKTILRNAGHISNLDQPEKFNQHLDRFLEKSF